jgi:molybdenum cofactor biosynthesis enzyme MoaA
MSSKKVYIEQRPDGNYAVELANAKRASAIAPTQKEAIEIAKDMHPDAAPHVERVRLTSKGKPDQWRKA